jgi:hypothetical protein
MFSPHKNYFHCRRVDTKIFPSHDYGKIFAASQKNRRNFLLVHFLLEVPKRVAKHVAFLGRPNSPR